MIKIYENKNIINKAFFFIKKINILILLFNLLLIYSILIKFILFFKENDKVKEINEEEYVLKKSATVSFFNLNNCDEDEKRKYEEFENSQNKIIMKRAMLYGINTDLSKKSILKGINKLFFNLILLLIIFQRNNDEVIKIGNIQDRIHQLYGGNEVFKKKIFII